MSSIVSAQTAMANMMFLLFFIINAAQLEACDQINCFLPTTYNKKIRPNADKGKSVEIQFQLFVESFSTLDVSKMEFTAYGYVIQRWKDDRLTNLNNTPIILESNDVSLVWLPDVYCINCRESNLDGGKNLKECMVRIEKDGSIYFSTGVILVGSCHMDLRKFPFDKQTCDLQFSSYGYNMSFIDYTWFNHPYVKEKKMDQYFVRDVQGHTRIVEYNKHHFAKNDAVFTFERRVGFYLLQLYFPTAMLVCLSWGMLCLDQESAGDRINIGLTLFLTMIFLHGYANTSLPKVSYVKSVDIFMVFSLAEILMILVESLVVTNMYFRMKMKVEKEIPMLEKSSSKKTEEVAEHIEMADKNDNSSSLFRRSVNATNHVQESFQMEMHREEYKIQDALNDKEMNNLISINDNLHAKKPICVYPAYLWIEKCCTVLLPLSYVAFNVWYWFIFVHITNY